LHRKIPDKQGQPKHLARVKNGNNFFVILVTAPDVKIARKLARGALERKLVACANILPKVESHYWWQGKIDSTAEVLIVFKTTVRNVRGLEKLVLENHPYDTPEFVALPMASGTNRYLDWLVASVQ
jgi:periplasmic divalent cation tolerance protein